MTHLQHHCLSPDDYPGYRWKSEFESHGRRGPIGPLVDVDKQLLDEVLAHCLTGKRQRSWPRHHVAMTTAGVLATLILTVWFNGPIQHASVQSSIIRPAFGAN